ncbi:MAG: hypothetical protein R3C26_17600 [Calditrichia bacterium]
MEPESPSASATARPNAPLVLQSLIVQSPRQLQLQFSEAICKRVRNRQLPVGEWRAAYSIIRSQKSPRGADFLSRRFASWHAHTLVIGQISDDAGTPLTRDSLAVNFTILSATGIIFAKICGGYYFQNGIAITFQRRC